MLCEGNVQEHFENHEMRNSYLVELYCECNSRTWESWRSIYDMSRLNHAKRGREESPLEKGSFDN